jgi:ABC-type transport system substrate-binding protein
VRVSMGANRGLAGEIISKQQRYREKEGFKMRKMRMIKQCGLGLSLIAFVMLLPAVASAKSGSQPQYGGILRIIDLSEGGSPIGAPWEVRGIDTKLLHPAIESLVREDINGNYHPWLATEWKIDQAKNTITLSLRKGVKFHDGTDFNAKAVKWCMDKSIAAKQAKGFLSVDVVDDYTVRINVDKYENIYLFYLAGYSTGGIVSPTAFENKVGWLLAEGKALS